MQYRFLGIAAVIDPHIELGQFGQLVDIPQDVAEDAIRGGCALLPDAVTKEIGFTEAEWVRYGNVGDHADGLVWDAALGYNVPFPEADRREQADFLTKKRAALVRLHELRTELQKGAK